MINIVLPEAHRGNFFLLFWDYRALLMQSKTVGFFLFCCYGALKILYNFSHSCFSDLLHITALLSFSSAVVLDYFSPDGLHVF